MSEFSSTPLQQQNNFHKSQAFAAALQRAKQVAAKIQPVRGADAGQKRPLDDIGQEPEAKKLAVHSPPRTNSLGGGGAGMAPPGLAPVMGGPVTSEDIKVPDKMVGLIIGRGGEQITRLQSESGCKIQMAPDSGGMPDRICTLTGNAQAISRAKELVNAIVHQRYKSEGPGGGGGGGNMHDMAPPQQQQHGNPSFVEVMIPGPKVGLVIGKGGETIKMLQEKSGAKMVVIQDGPNQEAEKPLRITGDPQKVEHARQLVYELLAEKEQRGAGGRGPGGPGGGRGGFGGGGRGGFNNRGGGDESTFVVPAAKCGVIIGRGGETIKQINQQSGAHCELDRRPNENPNEKVFLIRGTPQQIETAKQMISEKLGQDFNFSAGGGGPSNGQPGGGFGGPGGQGGQGAYPGQWAPPGPAAYHQPFHQQHMNPGAMGMPAQNTGQPDYSQQWIEYYRSLGMHNEADAIEQQAKAKAAAGGGAPVAGNPPSSAAPAAAPAPQPAAVAPAQNGAADYSAQWAQYYRSLGKIKEAELIEAQMKNKPGAPSAQPTMVPQQPAAAAPAPQVPGPYPGYQAPAPYPYQPAGYPYGQPGGYQYQQVGQPQPSQDQ